MSDDPVRLFDDPTAPAALRGDLTRAANVPTPAYDSAAGLARLTAAIGLLPPPAGPGGAPPAPAAPAAAGPAAAGSAAAGTGSVFASGTFWGFIAAGVVTGGVLFAIPPDPPRALPVPPPVVSAPARPHAPSTTHAGAAEPASEPTPLDTNAHDTPEARRPRSGSAEAKPQTAPTEAAAGGGRNAPAPSAPNELALEVEDLAALRAAARSDPARAVDIATAGQQRFARGVFGEEREALAIGALARSGRRDEAKRRAETFLARHPSSLFAEDVRRATGP